MHAAVLFFAFFTISTAALSVQRPNIVARALYPRQSAASCMYATCPPFDLSGDELNGGGVDGTDLDCDYDDAECHYDTTTGLLGNGDGERCAPMALMGGCQEGRRRAAYRREDNYTAVLRRKAEREEARRAASVARRGVKAKRDPMARV